ncbi:MAG: Ig-like domain-containing protein [Verrucomicrobiales bacterium]
MKHKPLVALLLAAGGPFLHAQTVPTEGLALWLKADTGVTLDGDQVLGWEDQSGNGNNAGLLPENFGGTGLDMPSLVAGAVNGKPAIRFDGVDDVLSIPYSPSLQPMDQSWTVVFVGSRVGRGAGDFPQIIGARPWIAGADEGWAVTLDADGLVASHFADGSAGHDAPAVRSGTALGSGFEIWQVEEDIQNGLTTFYKRADVDKSSATSMPTTPVDQFEDIYLGREIGGANNRRANIDLAETLIYNRVLSKQERLSLTKYLADRYGLTFTVNVPPTVSLLSPSNGISVAIPGTITLEATAEDGDGTIAKVEFYSGATLVATATQAPFKAVIKPLAPGSLSITAVAVDNRGERTVSAAAVVAATGGGGDLTVKEDLQLWLKADAGVVIDENGASWTDQSGKGNHALQVDPTATPMLDTSSERPMLRFDGLDDYLEIANAESLQPGMGSWTVIFVGKRNEGSAGDFPQVIGSRPWNAGLDKGWAIAYGSGGNVGSHFADGAMGHDVPQTISTSPLSLNELQVWQVEENRVGGTTSFYLNGNLNTRLISPMPTGVIDQLEPVHIGREIGGANNRRASMDLAEALVYNDVLTSAERESVTAYLASRYSLPAISLQNAAPTVAITAPSNNSQATYTSEIEITATAADSDGTITRVEFFAGSRLLGSVNGAGPYTVATADLSPGEQRLTARAYDNLGAMTTSSVITITNIVVNPPKPIKLIDAVDYSDTFTVGEAGEPSETNPRPTGMYNNNAFNGYNVETSHGNPTVAWTPTSNFSFSSPGNSTGPNITQAATGNEGATTGFAQSGGGDFNLAYGIRSNYVAQVDAILPLDRLDIGTYREAGNGISSAGALTVFFRRDTAASAPGISVYNGTTEYGLTNSAGRVVRTGIEDNNWHQFGVQFNLVNNELVAYVDGVEKGRFDLNTISGGAFANASNGAVGVGGAGFNGSHAQWFDNFMIGSPAMVGVADYSDTFTVTNPPRQDGLYNNNAQGAYNIENAHGNASVTWAPIGNFSFNTPASSTAPAITTEALGNAGAETGIAQSGGGDFSIPYGLRDQYMVAVDAILPLDRLDISSLPSAGSAISVAQSLNVFFRRDGGDGPGIALHNGATETPLAGPDGAPATTGVEDTHWHRFAVQFDRVNSRVVVYVDGEIRGEADLATFAGGIYSGFSNSAVGVGGAGFNGSHAQWFDNFEVGLPGPGGSIVASTTTPLSLNISRSGNQIEITWSGEGVLEQSDSLGGAWSLVPDAASGMKLNMEGIAKFFRLKK